MNPEDLHKKNLLNQSAADTEEIIVRLKKACGATSDTQLALKLGIHRQGIGAARKRGEIPPGWILKIGELSGYSTDWLRYGQGPQKRIVYSTDPESTGHIQQTEPQYDPHGGWQPRDIHQFAGVERGLGFGQAVEKLAKIYASKNQILIHAVNANLQALCQAVMQMQRRQQAFKELEDVKNRLNILEDLLKHKQLGGNDAESQAHRPASDGTGGSED